MIIMNRFDLEEVNGVSKKELIEGLSKELFECKVSNAKHSGYLVDIAEEEDHKYNHMTKIKYVKGYPNPKYLFSMKIFLNKKSNIIKSEKFILDPSNDDINIEKMESSDKAISVYTISYNEFNIKITISKLFKEVEISSKYKDFVFTSHSDFLYSIRNFLNLSKAFNDYRYENYLTSKRLMGSDVFDKYVNILNENLTCGDVVKVDNKLMVLISNGLPCILDSDLYLFNNLNMDEIDSDYEFIELNDLFTSSLGISNIEEFKETFSKSDVLFNIFDCLFVNGLDNKGKRNIETLKLDLSNYSVMNNLYNNTGINIEYALVRRHLRTFYKLIKGEYTHYLQNNN